MDPAVIEQRLSDLEAIIDSMRSNSTMPFDIGTAIKERVGVEGGESGTGTQLQHVNEAGAAAYNVAAPMTGFVTITINGTSYNIPYY